MSESTLDTLNQLLDLVCCSFPRYLAYAPPWTHLGQQQEQQTLKQIAADQQALADRIGRAILDQGAAPRPGDFPMEFTDSHDLSLDYIVQLAITYQRQDIAQIERCVEALRLVPAVRPLAEETLGLAKGHLKLLRSLLPEPIAD